MDSWVRNVGNALDAWGQEVGKNLDPNNPLHLAMAKAGQVSGGMATQILRSLDGVGQETEKAVTAVYNHVYEHASQVDWVKLSQEAKGQIQHTAQQLGVALSTTAAAGPTVFYITDPHLLEKIRRWIAEHPLQTIFIVVAGAVIIAPSLLSVPMLSALGFTAEGVAAGSTAASIQAMIGPIASGSIFALLQSAAMGGAGMAVVNGVVAGTAGAGIAGVGIAAAAGT